MKFIFNYKNYIYFYKYTIVPDSKMHKIPEARFFEDYIDPDDYTYVNPEALEASERYWLLDHHAMLRQRDDGAISHWFIYPSRFQLTGGVKRPLNFCESGPFTWDNVIEVANESYCNEDGNEVNPYYKWKASQCPGLAWCKCSKINNRCYKFYGLITYHQHDCSCNRCNGIYHFMEAILDYYYMYNKCWPYKCIISGLMNPNIRPCIDAGDQHGSINKAYPVIKNDPRNWWGQYKGSIKNPKSLKGRLTDLTLELICLPRFMYTLS